MVEAKCGFCGNLISVRPRRIVASKSGLVFCNRLCKENAQSVSFGLQSIQPGHYGTGKWGYRKRAFKHLGKICARCGYNKDERMLDVDHKDNNRKNGKLENLQVLCVWCHALKTRGIDVMEA